MSTPVLILCVVALLLVAAVLMAWRWLRYQENRLYHAKYEPHTLVAKTIVVNTCDGRTLKGVVQGDYTDQISLLEAVYYAGGDEHPLVGVTHIPQANVSFVQEIVLTSMIEFEPESKQ